MIKIKRFFRYIVENKWESASYFSVFVLICFVGVYLFNMGYSYYLSTQIEDIKQQNEEKEQTLQELKEENEIYDRYDAAIALNQKNLRDDLWFERLNTLIDIYEDLRDVERPWGWVGFDDFRVELDSVWLRWNVQDLEQVFMEWWIIDDFKELDFIKDIYIPSYTQRGDVYEFDLDANIKINGGESETE